MTNTKFRKRALLSSVAMLLVALVALGSATFAWFVDDPNATASGLTAKAQASTGLLISTTTDTNWTHAASLANGITNDIILSPAMTATGSTFFSAEAAGAGASTIAVGDGKNFSAVTPLASVAGTGVYSEQIKLKVTTAPAAGTTRQLTLRGVNMVTGTSAMVSGLTLVLVPTASGGTPIYFNNDAADIDYKDNVADGDAAAVADAQHTAHQTINAATGNWTASNYIDLGDFTPSVEELDFNLFVYLDGYDSNVYSMNATALASLIDSLNFTFYLEDAE